MIHGKDLKMLASLNIAYYFCFIILNILLLAYGMRFRDAGTINRYKNEPDKLFWNFAWFFSQCIPLIYGYFNNKNVQFKRYIFKMLEGRRHRIRFEESSLFIVLSWIGRRKILKSPKVRKSIVYILERKSESYVDSWNRLYGRWRSNQYFEK